MAKTQGKTRFVVAGVVIVVILLAIGAVLLTRKSTPPVAPGTSSTSSDTTKDTTTETDATDVAPATPKTDSPAVDPATLTSLAVQPLGVTVFYSKGTPGFEYAVLKTGDGTQYAQFTSADLIGTKCTDDEGVFASIIKNPSNSEAQTTSQIVKVGNDTYGLSLASAGCTSNSDLLAKYQTGFKNGFSSLQAL